MQFETSVIVAHAQPFKAIQSVRSTVLQSSITFLRERGHFERYLMRVDPRHKATIVESLAPSWMPIEVAMAHYSACDALALPPTEQTAIGESVGNRLQSTMLSSFMRTARAAGGITPMFYLSRFDRLYNRLLLGGSAQVLQTGPKDVEVELWGTQLPRAHYFRVAFMGLMRASLTFFGAKGFVKQRAFNAQADRFSIAVSWV
jgi:hypothetical protein